MATIPGFLDKTIEIIIRYYVLLLGSKTEDD